LFPYFIIRLISVLTVWIFFTRISNQIALQLLFQILKFCVTCISMNMLQVRDKFSSNERTLLVRTTPFPLSYVLVSFGTLWLFFWHIMCFPTLECHNMLWYQCKLTTIQRENKKKEHILQGNVVCNKVTLKRKFQTLRWKMKKLESNKSYKLSLWLDD
jgi:hypothetical protein